MVPGLKPGGCRRELDVPGGGGATLLSMPLFTHFTHTIAYHMQCNPTIHAGYRD